MRLTEAQRANVTKWAMVISSHYPEGWDHQRFFVKEDLLRSLEENHRTIMDIHGGSMYKATGFSVNQMVGTKVHSCGWNYDEDTKALREKLINTSPAQVKSLKDFKSWL